MIYWKYPSKRSGLNAMIYLDYSANTPVEPRVLEAFCAAEGRLIGNANARHGVGREAADAMAKATESCAALLGVQANELIFNSGASEGNNTAIMGISHTSRHVGRHIVTTPLEHASVSGCLTALQERGWEIDVLDVNRDGTIDLRQLGDLIRKDTVLVTLCAVDSELGVVQPVSEIAEIVRGFPNCMLHVDATQAIGKIPFSFAGLDTVSLAAHKFYGLNGSGLLFKRGNFVIEPLIHGGSGASLYRSGTPTLALAAALEAALELSLDHIHERLEKVKALNRMLREALSQYPAVRINSPEDAVPHILNVSVAGIRGTEMQRLLAEKGVCVSVKSACSTEGAPSKAVFAVSRDRKNALSSWRISLSHLTTMEEIAEFMKIFDSCIKETGV